MVADPAFRSERRRRARDGRSGAAEFSPLHALLGARAPVPPNYEQMRASALGTPIFSGGALVALHTYGWAGTRWSDAP
jgi:hypothetical protein